MDVLSAGKTVYDGSGNVYEYHHTFDGAHYCFPILELQTHDGDWHERPADKLEVLNTIYTEPPTKKLSEQVLTISNQIDDLRVKEAEAKGAANAARQQQLAAERELDSWLEKHEFMRMIGKMLDGDPFFAIVVPHHPWGIPKALDRGNVQAAKLKWSPQSKKFHFAKSRRGVIDGADTLNFFETQEELHAFVTALFENCCGEVMRSPRAYDPAKSYTTPHIKALRSWVEKWPHLEIPKTILEGESEFLEEQKREQIEVAKKRLEELQGE